LEKDDPKIKIDYSDVAKFIASVSGMELSRHGLMRALNDEIAYAPYALIERLVNRIRYDQDQECFKVVVSFLVKGLLPPPLLASSILSIFAEQDGMELTRQILKSESAAGNCLKWSLDQIQEMRIFICFGCSKVLENRIYFLQLPPSEGTAEECALCEKERKTGRRVGSLIWNPSHGQAVADNSSDEHSRTCYGETRLSAIYQRVECG
jgi:hypothetical protein